MGEDILQEKLNRLNNLKDTAVKKQEEARDSKDSVYQQGVIEGLIHGIDALRDIRKEKHLARLKKLCRDACVWAWDHPAHDLKAVENRADDLFDELMFEIQKADAVIGWGPPWDE